MCLFVCDGSNVPIIDVSDDECDMPLMKPTIKALNGRSGGRKNFVF